MWGYGQKQIRIRFIYQFCKEGEQLENYTKYKLKTVEELASALEGADYQFVIACT